MKYERKHQKLRELPKIEKEKNQTKTKKVKIKLCKVCGKQLKEGSLTKFCTKKCQELVAKEKRAKTREKKKNSISSLEKKLDIVFSRYVRLRDALKTTGSNDNLLCYTCDKLTPYSESQNMHFVSRRHKGLRWTEDNCKWGCAYCNVILKGNYIEYVRRMQKEYGIEFVDQLIAFSKTPYKVTREELQNKIEYYEHKIMKMQA